MRKVTFSGANVFLSRSLVAPEVFDAVHDALNLNGANVVLCSDPDRNSPNDYHVISSSDHEKFEDLRSKGCNLLGPQCILSCAKEHRILPKQGYTCCLAMDGVKVLASGFEREEKSTIQKLVTAMGGVLQNKASLDVNFVIVKNVLAAKYRHALTVLKKPIVSQSWLLQCWAEHRVVPQEPFRILPFTGLTICITRINIDERKEIRKLIVQNGGCYTADLTKKCTHLVSNAPIGDKYLVAQKWGHIHIVTRKWIDQSIAKRGCLDERSFPVDETSKLSTMKSLQKDYSFSDALSQPASRPVVEDLDATLSENVASSIADVQVTKNEDTHLPSEEMKNEQSYDCRVAEDSETEDNDLYLSNCRIGLVGFDEKNQSKLVRMIRRGGGTRHMQLSEKLTHIILGAPSENEKREVRHLAAWGVIHVVKSSWLEECDRAKRELSVSAKHTVSELITLKDYTCEPLAGASGVNKAKSFTSAPSVTVAQAAEVQLAKAERMSEKKEQREVSGNGVYDSSYTEVAAKVNLTKQLHAMHKESKRGCEPKSSACSVDANSTKSSDTFKNNACSVDANSTKSSDTFKNKSSACSVDANSTKSSDTFKNKSFHFSTSFPMNQRPEVIRWIMEGRGELVDNGSQINADFIIQRHGLQFTMDTSQSIVVSTHWIYASLMEGCLLDIKSHILYSPLRCHIPLPGFEGLRFCISQYDDKEKSLLQNLCHALGSKLSFKLTKKTTHLLCKFTNGPKFEAACNCGIQSVTAEWLTECITQNKMVPLDSFRPRPVTDEDKEAGLCVVSQYPTQAAQAVSEDVASQRLSQSQLPIDNLKSTIDNSSANGKRLRLTESNSNCDASKKKKLADVADAIEDLLAQSNKTQDMRLPGASCLDQLVFSSDHSTILGQNHSNPHSNYGTSRHWLNRTQKQDTNPNHIGEEGKVGTHDSFSETQTESQVVVYEEDLTGRQKIIDRVRSQSLTPTPDQVTITN